MTFFERQLAVLTKRRTAKGVPLPLGMRDFFSRQLDKALDLGRARATSNANFSPAPNCRNPGAESLAYTEASGRVRHPNGSGKDSEPPYSAANSIVRAPDVSSAPNPFSRETITRGRNGDGLPDPGGQLRASRSTGGQPTSVGLRANLPVMGLTGTGRQGFTQVPNPNQNFVRS